MKQITHWEIKSEMIFLCVVVFYDIDCIGMFTMFTRKLKLGIGGIWGHWKFEPVQFYCLQIVSFGKFRQNLLLI